MLQDDLFDADHFFSKGWVKTRIEKNFADQILRIVENQNFREESKTKLTNPQIPDWDSATSKKTSDNQSPESLVSIWDSILKQSYFDYWRLLYGEFSQRSVLLHQHKKGVRLPFHNDVHEGLHLTNCLFLSHEKWNFFNGGNLVLGKWRLDKNWWGVEDSVFDAEEIVADHGVLVSICNVVPTFCHAVTPMTVDSTRYTLISRCGYIENLRGNKLSTLF
jgi:hypothetical protein